MPPDLKGKSQVHNTLKPAKKKEAPEYPALLAVQIISGYREQ